MTGLSRRRRLTGPRFAAVATHAWAEELSVLDKSDCFRLLRPRSPAMGWGVRRPGRVRVCLRDVAYQDRTGGRGSASGPRSSLPRVCGAGMYG